MADAPGHPEPAAVEVRTATAADAEAAEAVWAAVAAEGRWLGAEAPLDAGWCQRFRAVVASPDGDWYLADDAGRGVVGGLVVQASGGNAHLAMALLDGWRGRGLGARLLDRGVAWAVAHGSHKVSLELWPDNVAARRLYERAGFVVEGRRRRHWRRRDGSLWDSLIMALVLDERSPGGP